MIKLTKRQILKLHKQLIIETGGSEGVRDEGLLESALKLPFQSYGDHELFPTIQAKAARLGFGLIKNHAMIDGNKRIGTHAMLVFLAINGVELQYTQKELYTEILAIAEGEDRYEDLLWWILGHQSSEWQRNKVHTANDLKAEESPENYPDASIRNDEMELNSAVLFV